MRFLVFQHIGVEHPGSFRDFMAADGIGWDAVELDVGERIPAFDAYDALLVMGGPMDVWEEDRYPWLTTEKDAIRRWVVGRDKPFLGVCLGHQLLAASLGGDVGRMAGPEVGIRTVALNPPAAADALFAGIPSAFDCLQWHGAEVQSLPTDAVVLAGNQDCAIQAMRVGSRAYGIQFHVEVTPDTVPEWGRIPAYRASLEAVLGTGAQARLEAETARRINVFAAHARTIYENFKRLL
jgi:GMP synthase-like glutamine amidotransferase